MTSAISSANSDRASDAALLTVDDVARMLACSRRHVQRLADAGKMPQPVKVGALVRFHRDSIDAWVADGCPAVVRPSGSRVAG